MAVKPLFPSVTWIWLPHQPHQMRLFQHLYPDFTEHISSTFSQQTSALWKLHPCISGGSCGCLAGAHEQISVSWVARAPGWASVMDTWLQHIYQSFAVALLASCHLSRGCLLELPSCRSLRCKSCAVSSWTHCHQSQFRKAFSSWGFRPSPMGCTMDKGGEVFFVSLFLFSGHRTLLNLLLTDPFSS